MGSLVGGALIGAGSDIISNGFNAIATGLTNKQAYKYNKKLSEQAFAQNKQMWKENNLYNSPASQIARLRLAGLNPSLAYGNGSIVGNSSSETPSLSYQDYNPSIPALSGLSNTFTAFQLMMQKQLNDSEVNKNNAEALEAGSRTKGLNLDNYIKDSTKQDVIRRASFANDQILASIQNFNADTATKNKALEYADALYNCQIKTAQLSQDQIRAQTTKLMVDAGLSIAQRALVFANCNLVAKQLQSLDVDITKKNLDIKQIVETWDDTISKIASDAKISKRKAALIVPMGVTSSFRNFAQGTGSLISSFLKIPGLGGSSSFSQRSWPSASDFDSNFFY